MLFFNIFSVKYPHLNAVEFSFTQLYIPSYSKTLSQNERKTSLLRSGINAKKLVFVVPYHISWQRITIRCVVTVDYGHFLCRHGPRTGFSKQNVYVNELNIVLLYVFCSDEFKHRFNAINLYRVTHDNGG